MSIKLAEAKYYPEKLLDAQIANIVAATMTPLATLERFAPKEVTLRGLSVLKDDNVRVSVTQDRITERLRLDAGAFPDLDKTLEQTLFCKERLQIVGFADAGAENYPFRYSVAVSEPNKAVPPMPDNMREDIIWQGRVFTGVSAGDKLDLGPEFTVPVGKKAILREIACERPTDPTVLIHINRDATEDYMLLQARAMPALAYSEMLWVPATRAIKLWLEFLPGCPSDYRARYRVDIFPLSDEEKRIWGL